jgi:putative transposase
MHYWRSHLPLRSRIALRFVRATNFRWLTLRQGEIPERLPGMVKYRRNYIRGGTFFFTVTLGDRRSSALVEHVTLPRAAFRKTRSERPFIIDAIVILPDHLHAILTLPPGDADFSDRWRPIKGAFTRSIVAAGVPVSRDHRGEYSLWQRRLWEHTIRDDYIHFNPVKHRLVSSPTAWPFSSLHRYVRSGVLAPDWGGDGQTNDASFGERAD